MSWMWAVIGIIVSVGVIVVTGIAIAYQVMRRKFRRQLMAQAQQVAEFPAWAQEHDYAYFEEFPPDDAERLRGLGPLLPFSDFALARGEHVFRRVEAGQMRYILQLTICADPGQDAPAVGAITVAVAEVARTGNSVVTDVKQPGDSRDQASVHARGRWVTSYLGRPLTLTSMRAVEDRLDGYLRSA
ncbi:hypothetical protein [Brevibacterium aurantiacum]|uniref:Uncharacterized protein n=1 Tax=Brevibacterium aurantiacum TaxID=273384 RepID=A0A556C476_BREAU|nr:hypothetical protein [Brevibacterium aurantiacum]TSI12136.1 hypothetical protein FO013_20910 [Brevibacterium aurantiacum]